jgi:small subunit ribosomal protein S6
MATATAQKRAREYETIYVLRQETDPDTADKVATRIAEVVGRESGKLVKVETWGRRKLAYVVAKQRKGVYYYLKYLGSGAVVVELERNLRMIDNVLKFQTVLLRDEVETESVSIDPEEIKFARLEPPPEDEKEESREKALGLVDQPEERARPEAEFADDLPEDEALDEDWTVPSKSAKGEAPAAPASAPASAPATKEEKS